MEISYKLHVIQPRLFYLKCKILTHIFSYFKEGKILIYT